MASQAHLNLWNFTRLTNTTQQPPSFTKQHSLHSTQYDAQLSYLCVQALLSVQLGLTNQGAGNAAFRSACTRLCYAAVYKVHVLLCQAGDACIIITNITRFPVLRTRYVEQQPYYRSRDASILQYATNFKVCMQKMLAAAQQPRSAALARPNSTGQLQQLQRNMSPGPQMQPQQPGEYPS